MKKGKNEVMETSQNFIFTILDNFDDKYKKRVWRYLYRSLRRMRKRL